MNDWATYGNNNLDCIQVNIAVLVSVEQTIVIII